MLARRMPHFRVQLKGQNFWLKIDDRPKRVGFFTTRFVEAGDEDRAERKAVELLSEDPRLHGALNERGDPPEIIIEGIDQISADQVAPALQGYSFFDDDLREPDA
jgi:hypothetical protein